MACNLDVITCNYMHYMSLHATEDANECSVRRSPSQAAGAAQVSNWRAMLRVDEAWARPEQPSLPGTRLAAGGLA